MTYRIGGAARVCLALSTILLISVIARRAGALDIRLVDGHGQLINAPGFRYLVEQDTTLLPLPGQHVTDSLALNIHRTYAPVVASGHASGATASVALAAGSRYMVTVMPDAGFAIGGANVNASQTSVDVVVEPQPLRTAQATVLVFHDDQPINGAPDTPAEPGLKGFTIYVKDMLGEISQDAFGHPIGTTYQTNPDGTFVLDGDGAPVMAQEGPGFLRTDDNGEATVRFLPPNKVTVFAVPPLGTDWVQVSTIEGTHGIDAFVKAGEPPYFAEWGMFDKHVFIGFVHPMKFKGNGGGTIHGRAVFAHDHRPPLQPGLEPSGIVENCWVGLNNLGNNDEQGYAQPCNADGTFTISKVPAGTWQLVVWDKYLDAIIDFRTLTVPQGGATMELGDVAVYRWYGTLKGSVFHDDNGDGMRNPGETGVPDQAVNIRFPDGSMYQSTSTDPIGNYALKEVFPFFHWMVAEVDFLRYKATGATIVVDDGGKIPGPGTCPSLLESEGCGIINTPQIQPDTSLPYRTQLGEVLTTGMLLYGGMTNIIDWGKTAYPNGTNGGIAGVVYYATTRAEDDPVLGAADAWEPGVPGVEMNLYVDKNQDGLPDDLDSDGIPDRVATAVTDSWDASLPTGCVGPQQTIFGHPIMDCAETIRTFNQVRPEVYDGAYAFHTYFPAGLGKGAEQPLDQGIYIVEVVPPFGYQIVKEEDKNVVFGHSYEPFSLKPKTRTKKAPMPVRADKELLKGKLNLPDFHSSARPHLLPPQCVGRDSLGNLHHVPANLALFPGVEVNPALAGKDRPYCDKKQVVLHEGQNAAADFYLFTEVPKAARIWGMVLNDVLLEFNPASPQKGSNFAPSWLPVSVKDPMGYEVVRTYTDEWGKYNALVPSTYSANVPTPTGVSPNMLTVCLNDPGPIPDPSHPGQFMTDPYYNRTYGQNCTNWDFWPGKTTPLDTPILPIGAFSANALPPDCDWEDGTPLIAKVSGPGGPGPVIGTAGGKITIEALGLTQVPDPNNPGVTITRDHGFGQTQGRVYLGSTLLTNVQWGQDGLTVAVTIPPGSETGQLMVERGDNHRVTELGITLHVTNQAVTRVKQGQSIQAAIDGAPNGRLIIVEPGIYKENLILYRRIRLQGSGAFSTSIQAGPMTPDTQAQWAAKMSALENAGTIALIPGERADFYLEQGAGITVVTRPGVFNVTDPARIDGLRVTGAVKGGGIFVNAYARGLRITNDLLDANSGSFGGGIRVGTPSLVNANNTGYLSSQNQDLLVEHAMILHNGAIDGGGGIALFNGTDRYSVRNTLVCGNYSNQYGGGIAHFGLSPAGAVESSWIVSNQSFDEGGGIIVAGELVPANARPGVLTEGSGSVRIDANLIQGNIAGDDGGGIRTLMTNGQDVRAQPRRPNRWHEIDVFNNMIVNNSSADVGGAIALDDSARVFIINNTIAHNDSTSTGTGAFGGPCVDNVPPGQFCPETLGGGATTSIPRVGGIAAYAHSTGLQAAFAPQVAQTYSNPVLQDNILWQNRSFYWDPSLNAGEGGLVPDVGAGQPARFWDLAVLNTPTPQTLNPDHCVLTDPTGYGPSNIGLDPQLASPYFNINQATSKGAAFGNFVTVTFLPTGVNGNYHIQAGSPARDKALGAYLSAFPSLDTDFDNQNRPSGSFPDIGADEAQ